MLVLLPTSIIISVTQRQGHSFEDTISYYQTRRPQKKKEKMVLPKGPFWEYVEEMPDDSRRCTFCGHPFSKQTPITRFKLHWSGVQRRGTTICDKVPEHVREAAFAAVDGPPEKKLKTTSTSGNDGAHNTISTSLLEQNIQVGNVVTDVETEPELYFPSLGDLIPGEQVEQECERNAQDNLPLSVEDYTIEGTITELKQLDMRGGSPKRLTVNEDEPRGDSSQPTDPQLLPNEFQTAPRTERAHQDCEGSTSDISSLFMEDNVVCNSIENTTTATGLMQHSERGSSHERLSINQVETHGDSTHPTDLPCLDLGIHYDQLCPSSLNNDVIMNDVEKMIRESGQLVVRGGCHEGPLVNCDEPQGDSSQPIDQPCHNLGRYHDQLCTPLVNMVGDPGQPGAGASSSGGLRCNKDAIKGDAVPTTKLVGQVQEAAFQAMHGGNKRHKSIASSSNVNDNVISTTPQERKNNEVDNLAGDAGRIQAPVTMVQALGTFLEEITNVMEDDIENGTGGVVQPGAGASSSGGLTCNTDAIKGEAVATTKLVGQAFEDHEKTFLSWLMHEEVSTIGISKGWAGWVTRLW